MIRLSFISHAAGLILKFTEDKRRVLRTDNELLNTEELSAEKELNNQISPPLPCARYPWPCYLKAQ